MTTDEIIKFIRNHIKIDDFKPHYGGEKYMEGYIRGMIGLASTQMIIALETTNQLAAELDAAVLKAKESTTKNTDNYPF